MYHQPQQKYYTSKELMEIFPEAETYLEEMKEKYESWLPMVKNVIKKQLLITQKSTTPWFWEGVVEVLPYAKYYEFIEKELKRINLFLHNPIEGEITQSDIERAKAYPFEQLLGNELKKSFMKCPFHNEKTASMFLKRNFLYCFSCNRSLDTIQFLIEIHGYTFPEAVKKLN